MAVVCFDPATPRATNIDWRGVAVILPNTPSVHDFAVAVAELTDKALEIADEPKPRTYGPERKGKGGKVKRW